MYHLPRSSLQRKWGHSRQRSSLSSHVVQMRQNSPSHKNTQNDTSVLKTKPATFLDLSISSSGSSISLSTNNNVFRVVTCDVNMYWATYGEKGCWVLWAVLLRCNKTILQLCWQLLPCCWLWPYWIMLFRVRRKTLAYNNLVSLNLSMYWKILL